jgi:hypothetical protein
LATLMKSTARSADVNYGRVEWFVFNNSLQTDVFY